MSDERYFLQATNEVDNNEQESALWAKAMALSDGDKEKAKYKYIKLRAQQLTDTKEDPQDHSFDRFTHKSSSRVDPISDQPSTKADSNISDGFLHITEFSKQKGLEPESVKEMIEGGLYSGKEINGEWYINQKFQREPNDDFGKKKLVSTGEGAVEGKLPKVKAIEDDKSVWSKLLGGDYGLAKTYWGFYGLGTLIIIIISSIIVETGINFLMVSFFMMTIVFTFILNISIWNAANNYQGSQLWSRLAKFHVVIIYIITGLIILSIIGAMDQ